MTAARIVLQFSHWIPAHLAAILLLSFRHQISLTPSNRVIFKCGALHHALIRCSSFFIITASRLFVKAILWSKQLPDPDPIPNSIILSIIIHGSALALLYFLIGALWMGIALCGNFIHKILFKYDYKIQMQTAFSVAFYLFFFLFHFLPKIFEQARPNGCDNANHIRNIDTNHTEISNKC